MPVSAEATKAPGNKISGPLPLPNMLGVSQAPTILPIKPVERRNSVAEDKKAGVSSFRTGDQDLTRGPKAAKGTSVRDMIARLNQRKQENDDPKEEDEEKITTSTSNASSSPSSISSTPSNPPLSLPKQNLKPYKPPLPSRPQNMRAGGSVSPNPSKEKGVEEEEEKKKKEEEEEKKEEEEEEEEIYDVLDDDDDASPQQQAEWYVAKFAFVATLDQALSFGRGDEILVYDTSGTSGWWRATLRGRNGLVPREYLKKKE
ncbi:mitotic apparatus protein p62-like [Scylla paramamosain]|uniref:mitotic apparatus protein p62-like n=1 Tax=Scylla paramamosain TaxID=85552 RepID=UPI003083C635